MMNKIIIQEKLFRASRFGNVKEMCELIAQSANPFTLDPYGKSAISYVSGFVSTHKMDDVENMDLET